jgi:hypothetical protein
LDKQELQSLGYIQIIIAILLIIAGLFTKFYSKISSTPDPPLIYGIIYPYEPYSVPLLVIGVPLLLIWVLFLWKIKKLK